MGGDWRAAKVGDFFQLVTGFAFRSADFLASGVPVIKIKNVKAGEFSQHEFSYVSDTFLQSRPDKLARNDDLLISMSGNRHDGSPETWVGKVALFRKLGAYFINQRVGVLRLKPGALVDARFASYLLSSFPYQQLFIAIATSSGGQANLSPKQIMDAPMRLPSLEEQRTIARILGALDDKIELNRQMNETLEAMARALFKSWFVDFDPVRAKAQGCQPWGMDAETAALFPSEFEESELGEIPKGWRATSAGAVLAVGLGGTWGEEASTNSANRPVACLRGIDVHELASHSVPKAPIRWVSAKQADSRRLEAGTILVEGSGSFCGRSAVWSDQYARLLPHQAVYSNFCKRLDPACLPSQSVVVWRQMQFAYELGLLSSFRTGTAFPNFDVHGLLSAFQVVVPPDAVALRFVEAIPEGAFASRLLESQTLTELRDTLLPKLLSGEVRVREAERAVEAAV